MPSPFPGMDPYLEAHWRDYTTDPDPPLFGAEEEWAEEWLQEKGLRGRKKPTAVKQKKPPRKR